MARKVAVVGSTKLPVPTSLGADIVDLVKSLGDDVVLLTRGSGTVDTFIATIAPILGLVCFTFPSQGGAGNWVRDVELARDSDEIIAIVMQKDMEKKEESGTLHVVAKALDQGKPVRLFTVLDDRLVGVASDDGDNP